MKKFAIIAGVALMMAGCAGTTGTTTNTTASTANTVAMNVFKTAVDNQCRAELNNHNSYKLITSVMGSEQKTTLENKVCGCVSEKAPESVTLTELGQAAISSSARTQVVGTAVAKTLTACVSEFTKGI
ncbi:MAG: hypothetical protein Q4G13_02385 [Moraxella sp.]|nr:hypothetical protein [Moraxella sp.]